MKIVLVIASVILTLSSKSEECDRSVLDAIGKDQTRWVAHALGAEVKECFRVVDIEGMPVTNANIRCTFWMGGGSAGWQSTCGSTDTNGFCTITGVSRADMEYLVTKGGCYNSHGKIDYMATHSVPAVVDGKWQPYAELRTVVLKRIKKPTRMSASDGLTYYKYPPQGQWTGFDLYKRDWVYPKGSGDVPDVTIRIDKEKTEDGYVKTMEVAFTNTPFAGAYEMTEDSYSDLKSMYEANTNALLPKVFKYTFKRGKRGSERNELGEGKYLVFRTRTKVDAEGSLKSAHYGMIFGNWRFCEKGGMAIERIVFNPMPNDANLEDAEMSRRSCLGNK